MSRGPGRVEREIEKTMQARQDDLLTVSDLVLAAYPGVNRAEKKHRVAVIRAADRVAQRLPGWACVGRRQSPAGELVYYNTMNLRSYTLGRLRVDFSYNDIADNELRAMADGSVKPPHYLERYLDFSDGSAWWLHVEINKAEHEGRTDDATSLRSQIDSHVAALMRKSF